MGRQHMTAHAAVKPSVQTAEVLKSIAAIQFCVIQHEQYETNNI